MKHDPNAEADRLDELIYHLKEAKALCEPDDVGVLEDMIDMYTDQLDELEAEIEAEDRREMRGMNLAYEMAV